MKALAPSRPAGGTLLEPASYSGANKERSGETSIKAADLSVSAFVADSITELMTRQQSTDPSLLISSSYQKLALFPLQFIPYRP